MSSENQSEPLVVTERIADGIAKMTLNRPRQRNAMNSAARVAFARELEATRDCSVVILTGAGPAFCAGIDLKEAAHLAAHPDEQPDEDQDWLSIQLQIRDHPAVFIAAVNGSAMGGGMTLVNAADLAVAADDGVFAMPEISFGLYPSMAGPSTQLRLSPKRAAWMVLTGHRIDGGTAAEWGLVNMSVPSDQVVAEAVNLATRIAEFDAVGLRYAKEALWTIPGDISTWSEALHFGDEIGQRIRQESAALDTGLADFAAGRRSEAQSQVQAAPAGHDGSRDRS